MQDASLDTTIDMQKWDIMQAAAKLLRSALLCSVYDGKSISSDFRPTEYIYVNRLDTPSPPSTSEYPIPVDTKPRNQVPILSRTTRSRMTLLLDNNCDECCLRVHRDG